MAAFEHYTSATGFIEVATGKWFSDLHIQPSKLKSFRVATPEEMEEQKAQIGVIKGNPAITAEETPKQKVLKAIKEYDESDNVNQFFVNGFPMWIDVTLRGRLRNVIEVEKAKGNAEFTEWYNGMQFTFTCEKWMHMLNEVEHYAYLCLNTTESHLAAVSKMESDEEIKAYDYKTGYPEKLKFQV